MTPLLVLVALYVVWKCLRFRRNRRGGGVVTPPPPPHIISPRGRSVPPAFRLRGPQGGM